MCGIAGIVAARDARSPDRGRLERAVRALEHRGPDGDGFYLDAVAGLGSTRLRIIDLEHGDQPIFNEDGSVVTVYNGEIWNHEELRADLERAGHTFRTRADTEVLVHGYEEWGEGLLERLSGMFAFAVWDSRAERLLLGRDRVGKKPLYYSATESGLAFGSDIRSVLLVSGRTPELETEHVPEFLFQRYVGAPRTLVRGISKLRPASLLTYDRHGLRERSYWRLEPGESEPLSPRELRGLLRESVRRRLMSDVPLGVLLSGGLDSSSVLGLMREVGSEPVASFTIGFSDAVFDERPLARLAAERFGSDHHEVVLGRSRFLETLPRLAWYRDEPIAEPSEIPLLLLSELAGEHVKVVLTGDGGDELFGGYPKYRAERVLRAGGPVAAMAMRAAGRAAALRPSHRRFSRAVETMAIREPLLRWASWFRSFSPDELGRLLQPGLAARAGAGTLTQPLRDLLTRYDGRLDAGRRMLVGDFLTWLPDNMLLRSDKVLMAASVEGRMPLLDRDLIERVANIPASARAGIRSPKAIFRKAVEDLLPAELMRGPKRGFPVPVARFLSDDPNHSLQRLILSDRALSRGLFVPEELRALVDGSGKYGTDRELKLFTLAALELYLRANLDAVHESPPEPPVEFAHTLETVAR
jgi:asparagine synthase (glutamine-hydrolysing)